MHDVDSKQPERDQKPAHADSEAVQATAETSGGVVKKTPRPRGFAAMDRKKVSAIASKGGKAAHRAGTAHQFTSDEAREAGRKGGTAHGKKPTGEGDPGSGTAH